MIKNHLEFEQPIVEIEEKLKQLKAAQSNSKEDVDIPKEIAVLEDALKELKRDTFKNLTAWQVVQLARHPARPRSLDYINFIFSEFEQLHGDRCFADDKAIVGGIAKFADRSVVVIGHQKGRNTKENLERNFGMPHPEGYRKANRLLRLAEKFKLPVFSFIDTMGAYPGVASEARGISESIAQNLKLMSRLRVPIISIVIGEGASGGALGIGVSDLCLMLDYSYYATIAPEGCATLLFKSAAKAADAAEIMNLKAEELKELMLVDEVIQEPLGGAHSDMAAQARYIRDALSRALLELEEYSTEELLERRYIRLIKVGI